MAISEKRAWVPGRSRATTLSLTSWVLFASSGSLAAAVMAAGWSPAAVTSVRIVLAAGLLVPVVAVLRPRALRFARADLGFLLGYGLLGVAGVQLLFFIAVSRIPVGVAMILVNIAPVLVAVWVRVVRGTLLPELAWAGILLAIAGLMMVAQPWRVTGLDQLGVAAGIGAAICSAGYFLIGEHVAGKHDSFGVTAAGLAIGAVLVALIAPPWSLPFRQLDNVAALGNTHFQVWLVLLILAVAGTVLPYVAGLLALRELPAVLASVLALVEPLVAAVLAWLLLGQAIGPAQLAGAAVLLTGAVLVQTALPAPDHNS
ncbi:DMT family transporter [Nocardia sp. NPDC058058]|uniref:EamA family transporter n=1 Tax=Nocardia sp. NPDC058058 TaxID=3346317 RepID=UPI0036DC7594